MDIPRKDKKETTINMVFSFPEEWAPFLTVSQGKMVARDSVARDLWGVEDIAKANQNRLKTGRSERLPKKIAEHEEYMRDYEG